MPPDRCLKLSAHCCGLPPLLQAAMSSAGPSAGLVLTEEEEQAPLSGLPDSLAGLLDDGWGMPAVLDAGWATWSGSDGSAAQPAAIAAAAGGAAGRCHSTLINMHSHSNYQATSRHQAG